MLGFVMTGGASQLLDLQKPYHWPALAHKILSSRMSSPTGPARWIPRRRHHFV